MKRDLLPAILTIDTVADAVQFTDAKSAKAIVGWINNLGQNRPEQRAAYDAARNVIALPSPARTGRLELGWWLVRWPSGELAAHAPAAFASMFGTHAYIGHHSSTQVEGRRTYHDRAVPRRT
jgi:hypothetical protein